VRSATLMHATYTSMATSDAPALENIDRQFIKADSLAGYMQRRSDGLFNLFGIMAFATGLAYLIYDKFTENKILLMFCMIILFTSLLAYYYFQTKHWFSKYLSYRALAETLRVRFYLTLAGIDRRMQTRELVTLTGICRFEGFGWISFALDSIESAQLAMDPPSETYALRARLVEQAWIEDQYQYFARKVAAMERHRSSVRHMKRGAFIAVLVVLAVLWMFGDVLHHLDARTGVPVRNVLTFCSGALAVVLGVWELHQNKMALQELLWQYRNQLSQFERARMQLRRTSSRSRRDDIIEELGKNSLMEIYLWAIHRYHREHAPPSGL
jgi:multisubunit Na+/H+ antiporter MnhB subunit